MPPKHAFKSAALAVLCACCMAPAFAVQDCELNGESVNPSNGNTTAGKTGLMRCKDRDSGKLVREQEIKAGKFMGLVRFYEDGQLRKEHSTNEKGNMEGRAREFSPTGQVLRDATYENGDTVGLSRSWYPGGQLRRMTFYAGGNEQAYAEYTERGQLNQFRCGDKPLLAAPADDAAWCGFNGKPSQVELYGSRGALNARSSYLAGQRVRYESFNDNGNPSYLNETTGNKRVERYYSTSGVRTRELQYTVNGKQSQLDVQQFFSDKGTVTEEKRWVGGKPVSEQTFYLNGQPRRKAEYSGANDRGDPVSAQVTEYYDSGKPASTGRFAVGPRLRLTPTGAHQSLSEDGRVVAETTYDDKGRSTREKYWDDSGKLVRDDEVFEDGSRKAFAK